MTQIISIFKIFSKLNELRKVKSRTFDTKKRKDIVNDAVSKLVNEQMIQLDNEYSKSSSSIKKSFTVDTTLVIYFLMIVVMMIVLYYH